METRSRLPRAASNPSIGPPQLVTSASASSTSARFGPPIKLGRLGKPALSRQPSIPLRAGAANRKAGTTSTIPANPSSTVLVPIVTSEATAATGEKRMYTSDGTGPARITSTKGKGVGSVARRLLPARSALALNKNNTDTSTHTKPPAKRKLLPNTNAESGVTPSAGALLQPQPQSQFSATVAPKASSSILAPRRTVSAQRSIISLRCAEAHRKTSDKAPGGSISTVVEASKNGRLHSLRPRGKNPLSTKIQSTTLIESDIGHCSASRQTSNATTTTSASTSSPLRENHEKTPSNAIKFCPGLGTPSRSSQVSSSASSSIYTSIGTPTTRIPTANFSTPALPRLVSTTCTNTAHNNAHDFGLDHDHDHDYGWGSCTSGGFDDQQQLKDLELSFTGEDDDADTADGEGDGSGSMVDPLDFGFATSRFAPSRPRQLPVTDTHTKDAEFKLKDNVFSPTSPRTISSHGLVEEIERRKLEGDENLSLAHLKVERDQAIITAREMHRDAVRSAWQDVIRAGEGDMDEIKEMIGLLRGLSEDLGLEMGVSEASDRPAV
ncbi:hypothetical protein IAT40_002654 [Kwoniella sp. CBS 6097]